MQETPPIPGVSIRRRLAVGGMAEIFLADEQLADGSTRPAVVKRLLPGAGPDEQRLFEREGVALAALAQSGCPHVVRLYRAGPDFLLLEWIDGVSLQALLEHRRRRGRPLPLGAALAVVEALASALEALGGARDEAGKPLGLVHRDVHPGNVLLGKDGSVKLADLGVVAMTSGQPTLAGLKGTLLWMAPEQLRSGQASAASDLYSAGLVAYEAFTGQPSRPVGSLGLAELLAARSALPTPPRALRPELPEALADALLSALAVDPSERPSVTAWKAALIAAAAPTVASPKELGALVADVEARPVVSAQRTQVPRSEPAPPATPGAAIAPPRTRRTWLALASLALVGVIGGVVAITASTPAGTPPDAAIASAPSTADATVDSALAAALDAGPEAPVAPDTLVATADGSSLVPGVDARGDATSAIDTATVSAVADTAESDVPRGRRRDVVGPAAPVEAVVERERRLRVTSTEGALHVRGGGARGLAPWTSPPIARADPITLHITGGANPVVAVVRARLREGRIVVSIGAPQGEVHRVACGGGAARETPIFDQRVAEGGLSCRLEASDGRSMSFVLSDLAQ